MNKLSPKQQKGESRVPYNLFLKRMFSLWPAVRQQQQLSLSSSLQLWAFIWDFHRVKFAPSPVCLPSCIRLASLHPCTVFFISPSLCNRHAGWECMLKSSTACRESRVAQNLVMMCFSSVCHHSLCLLTPSTLLKALISSLHFFICAIISIRPLLSRPTCAPLILLHFFCILHPLSRTRVNQMGWRCGSVVTQIQRHQRAKINHLAPSLSSVIFRRLCLCSPPLFQSSHSSSSLSPECHSSVPLDF